MLPAVSTVHVTCPGNSGTLLDSMSATATALSCPFALAFMDASISRALSHLASERFSGNLMGDAPDETVLETGVLTHCVSFRWGGGGGRLTKC
jgi:hypothetical protein